MNTTLRTAIVAITVSFAAASTAFAATSIRTLDYSSSAPRIGQAAELAMSTSTSALHARTFAAPVRATQADIVTSPGTATVGHFDFKSTGDVVITQDGPMGAM
jgi:hypothetical protein